MARRLRQNPKGPWHHVTNRGARHGAIFFDDVDRENFLNVLTKTCDRFDVEVHAYCLMGDHYHLLLRCPDGNLSAAIQYLASVYTQRFNRRHRFDGALFKGRFISVPTESDAQLLTTSRYIHLNPLAIDGVTESNLASYRWSSLPAFLDPTRSRPKWLVTHFTLALGNLGVAGYRAFIFQPSDESTDDDDVDQEPEVCEGADDGGPGDSERHAAMTSRRSIVITKRVAPPEPRGSPKSPP